MIVSSLYPTYETTVVGTPTADKEVYTTASWGGGQVTSMESYWLGWINYENLPACFHRAAAYIEDGTGDLVVKDMTVQGNFPCGYIWNNYSNTHLQVEDIYISNPSYYKTGYCWLFNENYPEYSGLVYDSTYSPSTQILACVFISDIGGNIVYPYGKSDNENYIVLFDSGGSTYIDDLYKFLFLGAHYTATKLVTVGGTSVTLSFDITADMLESGTGYIQDSSGMYNMRFYVVDAYFGKGCALKNNSTISLAASFTVKLSESYGGENSNIIRTGHYCREYLNRIWFYQYGTPTESNPAIGLGIKGDARIAAASLAAVVNGGVGAHATDGNVFIHVNDNRLYVSAITTLDDIKKSLSLYYRVCRENLPSYVVGKTYATDVSPDNEFLAKLKTGDIQDTTFKDSLRPWQYDKFTDSDFTEEDVPTPGPEPGPKPEPEPPGDDEHGGDDIILPSIDGLGGSFGFTTQYALRGSQIEELGALLWTGFDSTNPDIDAYLQNFVYRVDLNTGSVNMADIMEFFVSLRAYPLPLGNLVSVTAAGNDFYIGSGAEPLTFTTVLHTANTYLSEIDAGSVAIPFWFGDYRDYSTEITLYLPYCGTAELNAADVMGGTLTATYVVDLSTGSCTAYVMCDTYDGHTYPVAILPGQLGVDIPITASNAGRVGARLLGDRINVAENLMSVAKYGATGIGALMSGNVAGAIRSGISAFIDPAIQDQKLLAGMAERGAISAPMLSGGRGLAAFKNPMTAYVQVRSPFYAVPDNFADAVGDPAAVYVQIGSCSGFCRFVNVDVTGITTDVEDQAEIRRALENGVII